MGGTWTDASWCSPGDVDDACDASSDACVAENCGGIWTDVQTCVLCPAGWWQGAASETECAECPDGWATDFGTGAIACTVCAEGKYEGPTSHTTCSACTAGKFWAHPFTEAGPKGGSGGVCKDCPAGSECPLVGEATTFGSDGAELNDEMPTWASVRGCVRSS